jgi:DNA-binding transcriptional regulator YiaG
MSQAEKTVSKPKPVGYPAQPQSLGGHIRKKRMDLGISQGAVARQLGVSEDCVCYWEQNRNQPRLYQYPAIIKFLGYYPFDHETETFGGKIKRYKHEHGLSNEKLAKLLGVDETTIANWERNKRKPSNKIMKTVLSVLTKNTL